MGILMVSEEVLLPEGKFIKASLDLMLWKVKDSSNGLTVECMKENGKTERSVEKESFIGPMGRSMKVNLRTMNAMETEHFTTRMERNSKESGRMERSMERLLMFGLMVPDTMSIISMERNREKGCLKMPMLVWNNLRKAINL
jgi:hypothetical protein